MSAQPQGNKLTLTLAICGIVMALGVVVAWNYYMLLKQQAQDTDYMPTISRLDRDLKGVNQFGEEVSLHQLAGKVWVIGYVFTRCKEGCLGVMDYMRRLEKEFGEREDFHLVALTMDPERDTQEWLAQWTKDAGLGGENWWFMTGDGKKIRSYMGKYFNSIIKKRTDKWEIEEFGEWEHDLKLFLVDQNGSYRYSYEVMNATYGREHWKKLQKDVRRFLEKGPNLDQ